MRRVALSILLFMVEWRPLSPWWSEEESYVYLAQYNCCGCCISIPKPEYVCCVWQCGLLGFAWGMKTQCYVQLSSSISTRCAALGEDVQEPVQTGSQVIVGPTSEEVHCLKTESWLSEYREQNPQRCKEQTNKQGNPQKMSLKSALSEVVVVCRIRYTKCWPRHSNLTHTESWRVCSVKCVDFILQAAGRQLESSGQQSENECTFSMCHMWEINPLYHTQTLKAIQFA